MARDHNPGRRQTFQKNRAGRVGFAEVIIQDFRLPLRVPRPAAHRGHNILFDGAGRVCADLYQPLERIDPRVQRREVDRLHFLAKLPALAGNVAAQQTVKLLKHQQLHVYGLGRPEEQMHHRHTLSDVTACTSAPFRTRTSNTCPCRTAVCSGVCPLCLVSISTRSLTRYRTMPRWPFMLAAQNNCASASIWYRLRSDSASSRFSRAPRRPENRNRYSGLSGAMESKPSGVSAKTVFPHSSPCRSRNIFRVSIFTHGSFRIATVNFEASVYSGPPWATHVAASGNRGNSAPSPSSAPTTCSLSWKIAHRSGVSECPHSSGAQDRR